MTLAMALAVAVALTMFEHWAYVLLAIALAAMNFLYWRRVREHFLYGCANPAIVVSRRPCLIAVYTDLTKGWGEYPVVKVMRVPRRVLGSGVRVGDRVPTVALYGNTDASEPHWYDFFPWPVASATSRRGEVARVTHVLGDVEWASLDHAVGQVETLTMPGLYFVRPPGSPIEDENDEARDPGEQQGRGD